MIIIERYVIVYKKRKDKFEGQRVAKGAK